MGEGITGIGKDRAKGSLAGSSMIRMVPMELAPTPFWAPGQQPGWPHLADQPGDVPTERVARRDAPIRVSKKPHVRHAKHGSGRLLLGPSNPWDSRAGNLRIEPTGVPIAQQTVCHSDASTGPAGDRPTRPEIDIVWVSNNNQGALNGVVSKNHADSRQLT